MLSDKRCYICFFGVAIGKWCGTPICEECLSHRIEITEDMKKRKPGEKISKPSFFQPPKLKDDSEWEWWQQKARLETYEFLQNLLLSTANLAVARKDSISGYTAGKRLIDEFKESSVRSANHEAERQDATTKK